MNLRTILLVLYTKCMQVYYHYVYMYVMYYIWRRGGCFYYNPSGICKERWLLPGKCMSSAGVAGTYKKKIRTFPLNTRKKPCMQEKTTQRSSLQMNSTYLEKVRFRTNRRSRLHTIRACTVSYLLHWIA